MPTLNNKNRRMLPRLLALGGLALTCFLPALTARAQGDGDVAVGGEHILTVRFASAHLSVKQRADAVTDRLVTILSDPNLKPADVYAVPLGKTEAKIMVKNHLLVTVDAPTARFNQTTALALAQQWTAHLRRVLPRVNVKPNPNIGEPATGETGKP